MTLIGGQLLAMLVLLFLQKVLLTPEQIDAWGWRIPFFIGAGLAIVVYFMRRDMHESDAFLEARALGPQESPLRALMRHPREVAIVVGLTLGGTVAFYTYTTYMQKFLVNSVGLSKDTSTVIAASTLFLYMCLQPVVGAFSDIVGRRPVLLAFGVLGTLLTVPILTALQNATDPWTAFFLIMGALVIVSGYTAINAVVKAELFPTTVRAMGVGFPYAITVALFGGTAEYVALYPQGDRLRARLLLVCHGVHIRIADGLRTDARHAHAVGHAPARVGALSFGCLNFWTSVARQLLGPDLDDPNLARYDLAPSLLGARHHSLHFHLCEVCRPHSRHRRNTIRPLRG